MRKKFILSLTSMYHMYDTDTIWIKQQCIVQQQLKHY